MKVNFIEVHCSLWVRKIKARAREASVAFSDAEAAVIGANNLTFFCLKLYSGRFSALNSIKMKNGA